MLVDSLIACDDFCHQLIIFANILDPGPTYVRLDLDPNR